jgi:hypothetical protein
MGIRVVHFLIREIEISRKERYRPTDPLPVLWTTFMYLQALLKPRKSAQFGKYYESSNSTPLARAYKQLRLAESLIDRGYCGNMLPLVKQ